MSNYKCFCKACKVTTVTTSAVDMKFSYEFSNLCGTVYKGGNLIFSPDSNKLLSPVGSRITIFDMKGRYVGLGDNISF